MFTFRRGSSSVCSSTVQVDHLVHSSFVRCYLHWESRKLSRYIALLMPCSSSSLSLCSRSAGVLKLENIKLYGSTRLSLEILSSGVWECVPSSQSCKSLTWHFFSSFLTHPIYIVVTLLQFIISHSSLSRRYQIRVTWLVQPLLEKEVRGILTKLLYSFLYYRWLFLIFPLHWGELVSVTLQIV